MSGTFYLVDAANLVRLPLLLAAALLLYRFHRAFQRRTVARIHRRWLLVLGLIGLIVYSNFGLFHGTGVLHASELFHYYFSSKYFEELGYDGLYGAALAAAAEDRPRYFTDIEYARDLGSGKLVEAESLRGDPSFRKRFSRERWHAFRDDLRFYHGLQAPEVWKQSLIDHGYNAPPTRTLWTGISTFAAGAASTVSVHALALLDPALLCLLTVVLFRVYGAPVTALFALLFCANPLSTYDWVGGALLRFDWFVLVGLAICSLERRRFALAGALLAVAASLRVFPALFALGVVLRGVFQLVRTGRWSPRYTDFLLGFGLTGAIVLVVSTAIFGIDAWIAFLTKIQIHADGMYRNHIGLRGVVPGGAWLSLARGAIVVAYLASLRKVNDAQAALLGVALIYAFGYIASYYYCMLALLMLWQPLDQLDRPTWIALTLLLAVPTVTGLVVVSSDAAVRTYDADAFVAASAAMSVFITALFTAVFTSPTDSEPVDPRVE